MTVLNLLYLGYLTSPNGCKSFGCSPRNMMYLDGRARFKISKIGIPEMKGRNYCVYKEGFHPLIVVADRLDIKSLSELMDINLLPKNEVIDGNGNSVRFGLNPENPNFWGAFITHKKIPGRHGFPTRDACYPMLYEGVLYIRRSHFLTRYQKCI